MNKTQPSGHKPVTAPASPQIIRDRLSAVLPAIALSLFLHAFVMAVVYLISATPGYHRTEPEPLSAFIEVQLLAAQLQEMEESPDQPMSEEVKNLLASQQSAKTSERVSYTGKTNAQMTEEVNEYYRNLEKSEYDKLAANRGDQAPQVPGEKPADQKPREDYSYLKQGGDKSYSGSVAANYDLKDRKPHLPVPKPTYLCKSAGVVVIGIEVDQSGAIIRHWLVEEKSSLNECLREQSLKYAAKWHFDYSAAAPKKQVGTITFMFSAQ